MFISGTLIAHVDSGKVPYEKLGEYPVPEATGRWKPIAHLELVDTLKNQINCNYRIAREEYAVSNNGFKLFGVLDKKQAEIIGEELFKISEELKPQAKPAPQDRVDRFCKAIQAHERGGNPNSLPSRLNNPGAFRFAEWQRKFRGVPHSSGYTKFPSYTEGYAALRAFVRTACTVYGRTYNPTMTLYQFFGKYAPDSDQGPGLAKSKQYAEYVADRIGVSPNTQLKSLV